MLDSFESEFLKKKKIKKTDVQAILYLSHFPYFESINAHQRCRQVAEHYSNEQLRTTLRL